MKILSTLVYSLNGTLSKIILVQMNYVKTAQIKLDLKSHAMRMSKILHGLKSTLQVVREFGKLVPVLDAFSWMVKHNLLHLPSLQVLL